MWQNKISPILLIVVLLNFINGFNGELFTALIDLTKVFKAKKDLGNLLIKFASEEEIRLKQLKQFANELKAYNVSNKNMTNVKEIEKYFSNPINTYLFTKKFAVDWKEKMTLIKDFVNNTFRNELKVEIQQYQEDLPVSEDVKGAAEALIRMQETYKLNSFDLSSGKIQSFRSPTNLTVDDCFDIGHQAYMNNNFQIAIKWFNEALRLFHENKSPQASEIKEVTILDYLSYCMGSIGMYKAALKYNDKILEDPNVVNRERFLENKVWYLEKIAEDKFPINDEDPAFPDHPDGNNYSALCRNESPIKYKQNINHLKCFNLANHPIFKIRPVKMEVMFDKPRVVMFHDVIYDKEIEHIKSVATPRLNRATVRNPQTGVLEFASYRISKSAWLADDFDDITKKINKRIIALTGLTIDSAEDLQVVNYGIGGHYSPHFDHGKKRPQDAFEIERGNRIATLLFYISNVEEGGATVFTDIGAKVWPRKGSAAFWFNLKKNGDGDDLTRHAACPVLVGSKWVMNKWFHEKGQEFTRPCALKNI